MKKPSLRLSRLRQNPAVRALIRETHLHPSQFIAPIFINEALSEKKAIASMVGQYQWSLNDLPEELDALAKAGIHAVLLFGIPKHKDQEGSASLKSDGIIQKSIRIIQKHHPKMLIITDVCLCEYTSHGHCGILEDATINTDRTLEILSQQAISFANAGAHWVAPSSMTDGMVGAIRHALDNAGHHNVAILSYAVKYSSHFYGPFREAAQGAPQFGDRKTHQMDFANAHEALREAALDVAEGADVLMVKPAMNYLDIIHRLKQAHPEIPLCAYQVSGEYAMIKAGAQLGLLDEHSAVFESLIAIKRAGADMIISYFAKHDALRYEPI